MFLLRKSIKSFTIHNPMHIAWPNKLMNDSVKAICGLSSNRAQYVRNRGAKENTYNIARLNSTRKQPNQAIVCHSELTSTTDCPDIFVYMPKQIRLSD